MRLEHGGVLPQYLSSNRGVFGLDTHFTVIIFIIYLNLSTYAVLAYIV